MKKFIFTLLALMALVPAFAANYFTLASAVHDTLWIKYASVGFYQVDTLSALFDGRLDNWDLKFEFPSNFRLSEVRKDVDMTSIPYLNSDSALTFHNAPLYHNELYDTLYHYFYIDSLSSTITSIGYWVPNGGTSLQPYGTIKWEAGIHNKMAVLIFKINSGIPIGTLGTLAISGMMSSTSDSRGDTIPETTFRKEIIVYAGYRRGDVNGDGKVTIADVTELADYLSNSIQLDEFQLDAADINGDGKVEIADLTALIDLILT